jgi:NodT family efflux transporter outer membrane factor (OMF) lipoprotein
MRPIPIKPALCASTALALLLGACAPDLGAKPDLASMADLHASKSFAAPKAEWPREDWWKDYGDTVLDSLIAEGLKDSPTLKIAAARLRSAQAQANIAEADLWPTVTGSGDVMEAKLSRNQMGDSFSAVIPSGWHHQAAIATQIGYQLDLFGKNRAALAAATSTADAAAADVAEARLQLAAGIAATYASLVQLTADKKLAEEALKERRDSLAIVRGRVSAGLDNEGSEGLAEAQVWAAEGTLHMTERLMASTRNQIAALLGKGPDRGLAIEIPEGPARLKTPGLPESLTLNLVGRRPDIVAARERALAAAKEIDVAKANFYPNIQFVGQLGVQALDAKDLIGAASGFGQFGPAVSLPIFDYGRLSGAYRQSRAEYDAAVYAYDETLTGVLRDVATAYNNRISADIELKDARAKLGSATKAYSVILNRYRGGLTPYIDVLTAQTALIDSRRNVADLEANAFATDIELKRALGGGYVADNPSQHQE